MNSGMSEQELLKHIAGLPREISPDVDPWPQILARIDRLRAPARQGTFRRTWILGVAASAIAVITAVLLFGPMRTGGPIGMQDPADRVATTGSYGAGSMQAAMVVSEAEYQAAFREFIPVGESRDRLPSQVIEKIETGWTDMRATETALAAALDENPDDVFLNERMLELRARQLGFLKQLASLELSIRRRTI